RRIDAAADDAGNAAPGCEHCRLHGDAARGPLPDRVLHAVAARPEHIVCAGKSWQGMVAARPLARAQAGNRGMVWSPYIAAHALRADFRPDPNGAFVRLRPGR